MKEVSKKNIKILTITPGLNVCGGIESYVMNYYNNIKNEVEIDFITHDISFYYYKNIIEKNGNKVYLFPKFSSKNLLKIRKKIEQFFKENNDYDIIHCHMANAAFLYLKYAKKYGIKVRIIHSHQNKAADQLSHAIRNYPLIKMGIRYSNVYFACSKIAGKYLYKNKFFYQINNAIDAEKFIYDEKMRIKMRKKLKIEESYVIGNIGRFCNQKNQTFLIDIFSEVKKKIDAKLLLIGEGALQEEYENKIEKLNLKNDVLILPPSNEIEKYYQAMDVFVLPSLYEGLGIVNIEAQATGLKTIVSDKVPPEAKISELITYVDLNASAEEWADIIIKNIDYKRINHNDDLKKSGYDIKVESKKLIDIYNKLVSR